MIKFYLICLNFCTKITSCFQLNKSKKDKFVLFYAHYLGFFIFYRKLFGLKNVSA